MTFMSLHPRIGFILACIFLDALGVGLIVPVLPRLIGTLTDTPDAQTMWYGALMVSYGIMQFVSSPLLGALSDRIGRRPVLLGGIFGLGVMFAVPAVSSSLWLILASRILGGMLSANMAVAQAYIADITTPMNRAAGFGKIGAVFGIGFVVGPALGGILGSWNPTFPFAAAACVCLLNFLYGLFVLPESLVRKETRPMSFKLNNPVSSIVDLLSVRENRLFVLTLLLASLVNALTQCTWALYTEYRYGFTPLEIGLSVFALGLSISFVQGVLLQKLLTRYAPSTITRAALFTGSAALLGIGLTPEGYSAAVLFCFFTVTGLVSPLLTSLISSATPITKQGKTIGSLTSLNSLTGALAPVLGTPLLIATAKYKDAFLGGIPYFACAALLLTALVIFVVRQRADRAHDAVRLPLDED